MKRRGFVLLALALGACASVPPRLHSLAPSLAPVAPPSGLRVGLEPVDVAAILSRRELVLRPTPTGVTLARNDLWAEPLDVMLQRVLAEDLAAALGAVQVTRLPTRLPPDVDRLVEVSVLDLDGRDQAIARLTATWRIHQDRPRRVVREGRSDIVEPFAPPGDVEALVLAMNRAVAQLAQDIANALRATA